MIFMTRFSQNSHVSTYIHFWLKVLADSNNWKLKEGRVSFLAQYLSLLRPT